MDEDCDKMVSWQEFTEAYDRCRKDKTGYEPKRLYFIVEFMTIDQDNSGQISVEEAIEDLYLNFGKEELVSTITSDLLLSLSLFLSFSLSLFLSFSLSEGFEIAFIFFVIAMGLSFRSVLPS